MSALKKYGRRLAAALLSFAAAWLLVTLARGALFSSTTSGELVVQVRDDGAEPLAEVAVLAAGPSLGTTDAQGMLRRVLAHGARIQVQCPEAYRALPPQMFDAERAVLTFVCRPKLRTIAVVVHAPAAPGLTLRADQQNLGRLDDQGILHAVLRRAPGSTLWLSLEKSVSEPSAAVATRKLIVEDRDRVVLFEP
jgi:hypothetical protein